MRITSFLIALFISSSLFAQGFQEKELSTEIANVTVFLQGAQVTRTGELKIPAGKSILLLKSLTPHLDQKSIKVEATGDFTVLGVNHKQDYLNTRKKSAKIDSINALIKELDQEVLLKNTRLSILREKLNLLNANRNLGGTNNGTSLAQLQEAIEFYDQQLSKIKAEELDINAAMVELNTRKGKLRQQIALVTSEDGLPSGEIAIRVEADASTDASFTITYLVANAGWFPNYDLRVNDISAPLQLTYKADVFQNTGVDWNNVKLKLSNANPNQSGVAPELNPWYLNFNRYGNAYRTPKQSYLYGAVNPNVRKVSGRIIDTQSGEPLIGVNIIVQGTSVGTITDLDGNYSLAIPNGASYLSINYVGFQNQVIPISQGNININLNPSVDVLDEVVVTGYAKKGRKQESYADLDIQADEEIQQAKIINTNVIENQTTVEFSIAKPYTIKSKANKLSINIKKHDIKALYEYYAAPKLDTDAFLIAKIINWDQFNLLEGEVNLFFEDAYVGRSILDANSANDTLDISLGRDKSIVIERTKVDDYTKKRFVGANKIESRGFKFTIRNNKSQSIKLNLLDQIPVASNSDISVTTSQLSGAKVEDKTGIVKWILDIKPQQEKELNLRYEVKYPKREQISLE